MRVVIQRVTNAKVEIGGNLHSQIGVGLMILAGFENNDTQDDIDWICKKVNQLRIFNDSNGVMNISFSEIDNAEILVVSQFTLHAKVKKGNRPSYIHAAKPDISIPLYEMFIKTLQDVTQKPVKTGKFGANMQVSLTNDGPVTIVIDTKNKE
jgi:D-tyrosyl-tRNA(Tyr) deacylase